MGPNLTQIWPGQTNIEKNSKKWQTCAHTPHLWPTNTSQFKTWVLGMSGSGTFTHMTIRQNFKWHSSQITFLSSNSTPYNLIFGWFFAVLCTSPIQATLQSRIFWASTQKSEFPFFYCKTAPDGALFCEGGATFHHQHGQPPFFIGSPWCVVTMWHAKFKKFWNFCSWFENGKNQPTSGGFALQLPHSLSLDFFQKYRRVPIHGPNQVCQKSFPNFK